MGQEKRITCRCRCFTGRGGVWLQKHHLKHLIWGVG